jgi:hypothetical protein
MTDNADNSRRAYLGDGAYYAFDGHGVWLTTSGCDAMATNKIYLEPEVIAKLLRALGVDFDREKLAHCIGSKP